MFSFLFFFSAIVCPTILPDQEAFLERFYLSHSRRDHGRGSSLWTLFTLFMEYPSFPRKPDDSTKSPKFVSVFTCWFHFFFIQLPTRLIFSPISKMDFLKNKQVVKDKQKEIKKATALRAQGRGSSIVPLMYPRIGSTLRTFSRQERVPMAPPFV